MTDLKSPEELARNSIASVWSGRWPWPSALTLEAAIARCIAEDRLNRLGLDVDGCVKACAALSVKIAEEWERSISFELPADRFRSILLAHLKPDPLVVAAHEVISEWKCGFDNTRLSAALHRLDGALAKESGR